MSNQPQLRPVRFSIGLKLGLFMGLVLIFVMVLIGFFVIKQQRSTLQINMEKNMTAYLRMYRSRVLRGLQTSLQAFLQTDPAVQRREQLQSVRALYRYTLDLTNIPNFERAIFAESAHPGRMIVDSAGQFGQPMFSPKPVDPGFFRRHGRVDFFITSLVSDDEPHFINTAQRTADEDKQLQEKNPEIKLPPNRSWFEGFLPVYLNFYRAALQNNSGFDHYAAARTLYRTNAALGFLFRGKLPPERCTNLQVLGWLEQTYKRIWTEQGKKDGAAAGPLELTVYGKYLTERKEDSVPRWLLNRLAYFRQFFERYRRGLWNGSALKLFSPQFQQQMALLLEKVTLRRLNASQQQMIGLLKAGKLFRDTLTADDMREIATAAAYLQAASLFVEPEKYGEKWKKLLRDLSWAQLFPRPFLDPFQNKDETVGQLQMITVMFRTYLRTGRFPFPEKWEYLRLGRLVKNNRGFYPLRSSKDRADFMQHVFRTAVLPFRVGFVRIILNRQTVEQGLAQTTNLTMNISLALLLRLIFFMVLLSGLLVKNIRRMAEAAEVVGSGNLDFRAEIKAHDELGQLADQFNRMVAEIQAAQVALVEKSRMEGELQVAEKIQASLLPRNYPEIPGFSFAGYYSSQTEAGGDYYDVLGEEDVAPGFFGMVSADVSGHGVGSGLVMTMVRSVLRAQAQNRSSARDVLCKVNPQIHKDTLPTMFATAAYAVVEAATGTMSYASAGHNAAILYNHGSGKLKLITGEGVPLGMTGAASFNNAMKGYKIRLSPGDTFLMYTDGITEAMNSEGEEFEEERLVEAVRRHGGLPLPQLLEQIVAEVDSFTGGSPQEDDISLVAVRVGSDAG